MVLSRYRALKQQVLGLIPSQHHPYVLPLLRKVLSPSLNGEISLLPSLFAESLNLTSGHAINLNKVQLDRLGVANVLTWLAYCTFDNILDNEISTSQLPLATACLRAAQAIYLEASSHKNDQETVKRYFDIVDVANFQEQLYCRAAVTNKTIIISNLPSLKRCHQLLGRRSVAHCLGIALIANSSLNFNRNFNQTNLVNHLLNYCAARQLCDDIYDWEDDLKNGRLTYVVTRLLKKAGIKPDHYKYSTVIKRINHLNLQEEMVYLLNKVSYMTKKSNKYFEQQLGINKSAEFLQVTTGRLEEYAKSTKKLG